MKDIFAALDALLQKIIYCFEFPGGDDPDDRIRRGLAWAGVDGFAVSPCKWGEQEAKS